MLSKRDLYVCNIYFNWQTNTDDTGLDLDHMKLALKALAKLHGMSFAYFNNANTDLKEFSNTLKLMVDKHYQPSASIEVKNMAKNELNEDFEKLMNAISGTPEGNYA